MKYKNEFNLEKRLKLWKEGLCKNPNLSDDTINELESHLIDEIEELKAKDISEDEVFFIAKKRLGNIELLGEEFNKIDKKTSFKKNLLFYLNGAFLLLIFKNTIYFIYMYSIVTTHNLGIQFKYFSSFPFPTVVLIITSISLFFIFYWRYKRGKMNLNILKHTPIIFISLVVTLFFDLFIASKFLKIFKYNKNSYTIIGSSLHVYEFTFVSIMILSACILFFNLKKNKRNKVADKYYKVI